MNTKIINYDTNNIGYHPYPIVWLFWHNEIDEKDITNRFSWGWCGVLMHRNWYIQYVELWNWDYGKWLLWSLRDNRVGSWWLWSSDNGLMIPVMVNNSNIFNQIFNLNNNNLMPNRSFYAHLYWYNGYAASYRFLNSKLLSLDARFVAFINNNQYANWSLWGKLVPLALIEKYFIKWIKPLEANQFRFEVLIECDEWIVKYFGDWVTQASSNEMKFSIPLSMIIDEEIAERREAYFNLRHGFCDFYIRQNAEAGNSCK